jgi:hypothetical protein
VRRPQKAATRGGTQAIIAEVEKAPVTRDERPAPSALLGSQQSTARPKLVHPLTPSPDSRREEVGGLASRLGGPAGVRACEV